MPVVAALVTESPVPGVLVAAKVHHAIWFAAVPAESSSISERLASTAPVPAVIGPQVISAEFVVTGGSAAVGAVHVTGCRAYPVAVYSEPSTLSSGAVALVMSARYGCGTCKTHTRSPLTRARLAVCEVTVSVVTAAACAPFSRYASVFVPVVDVQMMTVPDGRARDKPPEQTIDVVAVVPAVMPVVTVATMSPRLAPDGPPMLSAVLSPR